MSLKSNQHPTTTKIDEWFEKVDDLLEEIDASTEGEGRVSVRQEGQGLQIKGKGRTAG